MIDTKDTKDTKGTKDTKNMDILGKIKVILPHWIHHNKQHGEEFVSWVQELNKVDNVLADQLRQAVVALSEAQAALEKTLEMAGGGEVKKTEDSGHSHSHRKYSG
jgi:preprotein translocase subunit Sec63